MPLAITRKVSPNIGQCELTHLDRQSIEFELAQRQHLEYENCLQSLGFEILSLPSEPELPDSVFVEDTAVVLDEIAVITRPGAESRRPETASIAQMLSSYRQLVFIQAPGILDGGDVLCIKKTLYVGVSRRSNEAAIEQMQTMLKPYGYSVVGIRINQCLHLKTAVTQVAENTLLINPEWVSPSIFSKLNFIEVDPREPFAANALRVGNQVVYSSAYAATRQTMEAQGISVRVVETTELSKAEGGVTCCSLILT